MQNEKIQQITEDVAEKILQQQERPLLVAITGDSGSGKNFYLEKMEALFNKRGVKYTFLDFDDFLIPRKERIPLKEKIYTNEPFAGKSHWEILENWFYLDKFKNALSQLKAGKTAHYFPYSRETGDIDEKEKVVEPQDIVLVATSIIFDIFDYIVLIEVDQEKIIQRKITRDSDLRTPQEVREMHENVQGYFWERNRPKNPNIIIDNNDTNNPFIAKE